MQKSEKAAVDTRAQHRKVFQPTTAKYGGEIIQYYGDGTLSIFESAVSAVECACEMQRQFLKKPAIPVRVGIHMGDIILTDNDIIGDSVNLASRVESMGVPGSVIISGKVAEEIKNKDDLPHVYLGSFHFKNDNTQRQIFALSLKGLVVPKPTDLKGKLEAPAKRKSKLSVWKWAASFLALALVLILGGQALLASGKAIDGIAVLPLSNRLEEGQEHITEVFHEDLISKLHQIGVKVTPYESMATYKIGTMPPMRQVASDLGVDALVSGILRREGDELSIEIKLISGNSGQYMGSPITYEAQMENIRSLYNDVIRGLAAEIQVALTPEAEEYLQDNRPIDPEALELYSRGRMLSNRGSQQDLRKAIEYYNQAIAVDPSFGKEPAQGLVESYLLLGFGSIAPQKAYTEFAKSMQMAIAQDPSLEKDHHLMAMIRIFSDWDWNAAEEELLKAIEQDAESWQPYDSYSQFLWILGRTSESVTASERSVEKDRLSHFANCDLAFSYYYDGQIQKARDQLEETLTLFGSECSYHRTLDYRLRLLDIEEMGGSFDELIKELETFYNFTEHNWVLSALGFAYGLAGNVDEAIRIATDMESAEGESYVDPTTIVPIYVAIEDFDKAFELLDKSVNQRSFILPYVINVDPRLQPLRSDSRFDDILLKMNLLDISS